MIREPMIFAGTSDFSGKIRGKAFPAALLEKRAGRGVGWTPTNVQITCFDAIADSPYGALGDLLLVPDQESHAHVDFGDGSSPLNLMLGNVVSLENEPWECCTRSILLAALVRLRSLAGFELKAAFEHEFHLAGGPALPGEAYTHAGYRNNVALGETAMAALNAAGIGADTFMREYGPDQYEITISPAAGVRAADHAALLREIIYATAQRHDRRASFTPLRNPEAVGNGVHIHMSFLDALGKPATYDPNGPAGMSADTGSFIAGILKYLDSILAVTAPSDISYLRLTPHRWSAAYNNLGFRDREASVRICPVTAADQDSIASQYNFEFRAADAAASPHLALAAIVHAGCQGLEENLPAPVPTEEDLSLLDEETLADRDFIRLPQTLSDALDQFASNSTVAGWFPGQFANVYRGHKLGELLYLNDMDAEARCAAYETVY